MASLPAVLLVAMVSLSVASGRFFWARLPVTKDVTLERGSRNFNYLPYLLVGKHPGYPNKRSLLQFSNLPWGCTHVLSASLKLYFVYAHKASFMSNARVPTFPRRVVAHRVLKSWSERYATSTKRFRHVRWSRKLLGLGLDAVSYPTSRGVTVYPRRGRRWYSIDVTRAVRWWRSGRPNYGLLIRATNEYRLGRDFRFASNRYSQRNKHAYIQVLCRSGFGGGFPRRKPGRGSKRPV